MFVLTNSSLWQHKTTGIVNFDQDRMPFSEKTLAFLIITTKIAFLNLSRIKASLH
jgi:hypothetical protein